jgi:hypothetical protein
MWRSAGVTCARCDEPTLAELRANSRCRPQNRRLGLGADADGSFPGSEAAAGFRALRFAAIARVTPVVNYMKVRRP